MGQPHIIAIIIFSGALGGVASFIIARRNKEAVQYKLYEAIFLGVIAAATVPLFLNIASSNLLSENTQESGYIFAGFCILAGLSAVRFLRTLSDQALQLAKEAKETATAAQETAQSSQSLLETVIDAQSDQNVAGIAAPSSTTGTDLETFNPSGTRSIAETLSDEDRLSLAMRQSRAAFLTVDGLAKATQLPSSEIIQMIEEMEKEGRVKRIVTSTGKEYWAMVSEKN